MPEWIGKTIGKVHIERELAKGGMAEVYLGRHLTLDRAVAVKVMHNYIEADTDLQSRFEREAKVVAGLRHPNIVQIFDFDTAEGHPYIVMEYLRGPSLAVYLRELHKYEQRMPPGQVARLLITIATALDYAHEQGVIHRDIKPGNIILHNKYNDVSFDQPITERTEPVLTDFGLVRIAQSVTQTASGTVSGTPAYMSPEQAQGIKVDQRTDIYSLGVVLYELVAGRVPFEADTSWTVIFKHINEPPPPIPGLQPSVQRVIDRALEKDPNLRYQTCRELAAEYMDAIGMLAEANTLRMSLPSSGTPLAAPPSKKRTQASGPATAWRRLASVAGFTILFVAIAAFGLSRFPRSSANQPTATSAITQASAEIHSTDQPTVDPNVVLPVENTDSIGILRFQDGTAFADQVTISTSSLPLPPEGNQYEAWLIEDDGEQRISIGFIEFDENNQGFLLFVDEEGQNLLGRYSGLEITVEPNPDPSTIPSGTVAYAVRLPADGLTHVRHLLFLFGATPKQIGFIRGLDADTQLINDTAQQMLAAFEAGDEIGVRMQAESMLNVILGNQSEDYKDWNSDGGIDDPGDGYGLLLNGDNLGYIQGTITHADLALASPNATQNMLTHGGHVKIAAQNVAAWTPQLRDQLIEIINAPFSAEMEGLIRQAVATASQIRNGIDTNGNEKIEPISGEGGAVTAYEHSYYMADMLILP